MLRGERVDADLLVALGGPGAGRFLDDDPQHVYWLRVWGARGLLWAWDGSATGEISSGLVDESWHVREMCLTVVARHLVDDLLEDVAGCREDPVPRVRTAAERALVALTHAGG